MFHLLFLFVFYRRYTLDDYAPDVFSSMNAPSTDFHWQKPIKNLLGFL